MEGRKDVEANRGQRRALLLWPQRLRGSRGRRRGVPAARDVGDARCGPGPRRNPCHVNRSDGTHEVLPPPPERRGRRSGGAWCFAPCPPDPWERPVSGNRVSHARGGAASELWARPWFRADREWRAAPPRTRGSARVRASRRRPMLPRPPHERTARTGRVRPSRGRPRSGCDGGVGARHTTNTSAPREGPVSSSLIAWVALVGVRVDRYDCPADSSRRTRLESSGPGFTSFCKVEPKSLPFDPRRAGRGNAYRFSELPREGGPRPVRGFPEPTRRLSTVRYRSTILPATGVARPSTPWQEVAGTAGPSSPRPETASTERWSS